MRIALVIHALAGGGAERVLSTMANYWAERGTDVHVICLDDGSVPPCYPLQPGVTREHLAVKGVSPNLLEALMNNGRRMRALRRAICRAAPSAIISFSDKTNILALLSVSGCKIPVFACEHTYPKGRPIGACWELLRRLLYPRAHAVVTLTESGLRCFSRRVQRRGCVIPNPVMVPLGYRGCALEKADSNGKKRVIALGRLEHVKGFDMLVSAFGIVSRRYPEWDLEIWGEGSERQNIQALVKRLSLADRVRLPGITTQPFEKLKAADLFVLSSRTEGFPMALCEAMACGLPVVSFNCQSGPGEIVRDGLDGVLVTAGDLSALAESLDRLFRNRELRCKLGTRATEVLDRFGVEVVMKRWNNLLAESIRFENA